MVVVPIKDKAVVAFVAIGVGRRSDQKFPFE